MILQSCIDLASSFIVPEASEKRCQKVMPWTDAFVWEHSDGSWLWLLQYSTFMQRNKLSLHMYTSLQRCCWNKQSNSNLINLIGGEETWFALKLGSPDFQNLTGSAVCLTWSLDPNKFQPTSWSRSRLLRPSPTMRPEEVYEPGIWAVSLHILSSLVPTCDRNLDIDCNLTWKLLDPRNGPSNSMTKFVLFPFWAVAIAITPPVVEGVHPASCDAGWSYDWLGATLELAGGWWRVRWKTGCPATLEDYRSKGTTGILFSTKSP